MAWDDGLEGPALAIAAIDASPLRVMAGPGTGKTFAIRRRVGRLLEQGDDPRRILAVTFTRNAASNLVEEIRRLGVAGADEVWAGTLHAFCFAALSRQGVLELLGRVPRPLVTFMKSSVLQFEGAPLLQDLDNPEVFGDKRTRTRTIRAFEAAWARLQSDIPGWPADPHDRQFQDALLGWLRFHQAMLIGELVPEALRYLRANPAAPERTAFDHVIVDEYQDLNRAEQVLLDLLVANASLIVVGDEDQSIYLFRYAHPEGIREFHRDHLHTTDQPLDQCRRCSAEIVELANHLIQHNHAAAAGPRLRPHPTTGHGQVQLVQWRDLDEEAAGISRFVSYLVDTGRFSPGEVLILSPRRLMGYRLRDAINAVGVQAHSFYHEEALADLHAQRAFALLTLLAKPNDRVALRFLLGLGSPSWREAEYRRLRAYCEGTGESPWGVLDNLARGQIDLGGLGQIRKAFEEVRHTLQDLRGLPNIDEVIGRLFPEGDDWAELLRAAAIRAGTEGLTYEGLHARVLEMVTAPEIPEVSEFARIMSLHKSKGLTSRAVVVTGCVQGLIPGAAPEYLSPEEEEEHRREQRRLFYVAMTRARELLVLSSVVRVPLELAWRMGVQARRRDGGDAITISSQFLNEMGPSTPAAKVGLTWLRSFETFPMWRSSLGVWGGTIQPEGTR